MKHLFIALALALSAGSAQAATTWNYNVERASMISGGKVKISTLAKGRGFRKIKFKYKLDTAVGEKAEWFPYNLPEAMFDPAFLAKLAVGEKAELGSIPHAYAGGSAAFSIVRQSQDAYLVSTADGQFRFYARSKGGAWKRIEFTVKSSITVRLNGNLLEVTNE